MKNKIFPLCTIFTCTTAMTLFHLSCMSASYGAEIDKRPTSDAAHDSVLQKICVHHGLTREHFLAASDKPVPIFDIQGSAKTIHEQQLSQLRTVAPHLLPVTTPNASQPSTTSWGSVFYAPIAFTGRILYSPIALGSWAYNSMPSFRSSPKNTMPSTEKLVTSPPTDDGFLLVAMDSKDGSSTPQATTPISTSEAAKAASSTSLAPSAGISTTQESSARAISNKQQIIIALDGGGSRGYMEALWVKYIEAQLKADLADIATVISGSSIGGIIGIGLAIKNQDNKPCMRGSDVVNLFDDHFSKIFYKHSSWNVPAKIWDDITSLWYAQYDPQYLEQLLQQYTGSSTFSSLYNPNCNLHITSVDSLTNNPFEITNISHPTMAAWEGGRSTSAAPTFFPPFQPKTILPEVVRLVDGGVWQNNPAFRAYLFALARAQALGQTFNPIVLSLGTGNSPVNSIPQNAGITSVSAIIDSCIGSQVSGTDMTMSTLLKPGIGYFRINPTLSQNVPLDEFFSYKDLLTKAAESQYPALEKFIELDALRLRLEAK